MKVRDYGDGEQVEAVRRAHRGFYNAYESLDLEAMGDVWLKADFARCIHAGWQERVGWTAIRESWEKVFDYTQAIQVLLSDVGVVVAGDMAWVSCIQSVLDTSFDDAENLDESNAIATNIFLFLETRWLLIHHHASPLMGL